MHEHRTSFLAVLSLLSLTLAACGDDGGRRDASLDGADPVRDGGFVCLSPESKACIDNVFHSCETSGEFLSTVKEDCEAKDQVCISELGCAKCTPDRLTCKDNNVVECNSDGSSFEVIEECNRDEGFVCRDGRCKNLCDVAVEEKSYVGCEFYAADLDNAAITSGRNASAQQYALVVSNPGKTPTEVTVEVDRSTRGEEEPEVDALASEVVRPGDLQVFELPRREVDGSSSNAECFPDDRSCPGDEVCVCSESLEPMPTDGGMSDGGSDGGMSDGGMPLDGGMSMDGGGMDGGLGDRPPCFCRVSADSNGLNDGTHTAVTSQAYRIRSQLPIIAYQFNPLDNVGVFSNDASLLVPTSAIGSQYTVVGWPQTIADGPDDMPMRDFASGRDDEDLRATLTIVGTTPGTQVDLTMGPEVRKVVGAGPVPEMSNGDEVTLEIGPFDVINLETEGLNADFTSTLIEASQPVTVFTGSEASDVPRFDTYATRQCCADHLEEQLFPDDTLGSSFVIARMPPRTEALNDAFVDPANSVAEVNEPEWVRVVATSSGTTKVHTTLPAPDDLVRLDEGESVFLRADQDFEMWTESSKPVAVLQAIASQQAVGIPNHYPGGDPAILAVPPEQQWRQNYVFLTPDKYAFDFVTITARRETSIELDGKDISEHDCTRGPADGIERMMGDPPPEKVIYRCQFSYPDVVGTPPNVEVREGMQKDGVHTVVANDPVAVAVYGFDAFVSYAYGGGLDLMPIPR